MNKGELIDAVASELGETKAGAARAVEVVLQAILLGVRDEDKVAIAGFGTFRKKRRKARTAINPSTKQTMEISSAVSMGFTVSPAVREVLEGVKK
ncbi:MAG: HU family DNA-binding protein, partial [Phycisphaerales bacterium]|nr:HU family DNA-binding protein [Phycisphaerales bacterium]